MILDNTDYLIGIAVGLVLVGLVVWLVIALRRKAELERRLAEAASEQAVCLQKLETQTQTAADLQTAVTRQDDQIRKLQTDYGELNVTRAALEVQVLEKTRQLEKAEDRNTQSGEQIGILQEQLSQLKAEAAEMRTVLDEERKQSAEKIALLHEARDQLKIEFQNLAQEIFEDKSRKFAEQNRTNIDHLIGPLREQIGDFKKRVEDVYDKETRDRTALQTEIHHLKELNQQISKEALNLTRALKGDSKARGNWGEVILERVLEASGLKKGREYDVQVSLKDADGKRYQPDVIVRLPQDKDVVVDAKVSLKAYESYYSAEDSQDREAALKSHIDAMRTHIRALAAKRYEELEGVRSLDFVLMFVPIEAAFLAAVDRDRELFSEAFEKNIMVVSPSTLLVTLRTIENIWRNEYQNRHALQIAEKAGGLYNKFVGFVDALEEIGRQLDRAKASYQTAHDRLANGRGNLIRRTQELKALGIKAKKELPRNLIDSADGDTAIEPETEN
ncbi:MAG: DNA recombination protein RmuC [Desulfobacteraceae bacterium]|jgi:DNA recombination protein RmuC